MSGVVSSRIATPNSVSLAVTFRCNSKCITCDIWRRKEQKELPPNFYQKLPTNLGEIEILGGEPFLRNDLLQIIKILKKRCPKAKILVATNGLLPVKIAEMVPAMIKITDKLAFRVSLDGWGEVHNRVRGVPRAFEEAIKTIKTLKGLEVKDLGIIFTLIKINKDELPKVLAFCRKEKLNFSLNLVHESPIYFGKKKIKLRPKLAVIEESLKKVSQFFILSLNPKDWAKAWFYRKLINYAKTGKRPIRCGAGENFFYVDPFANIYFCQFKNWKIGNLKKQSFLEIWQGEKRKKYSRMARNCHSCFMICTAKDRVKRRKWKILKELLFRR